MIYGKQAGILLQPILVIGFEPVDLPVFEREEGHSTEYLVVVLQRVHPVVLGQYPFQSGLQAVVRAVADTQHIDAVAVQPVAEAPIGVGKLRGDKNKIHKSFSIFHKIREIPFFLPYL